MLVYRDLHELLTWSLELVDDPRLAGHPRRSAALAAASSAAWLVGDMDRSIVLADRAIADAPTPEASLRARIVRASTALFRDDPLVAADLWQEVGDEHEPYAAWVLGPAALAAHYGGDGARARALLERATVAGEQHGPPCHQAFTIYTAAEMEASTDPDLAVEHYGEAIALAGSVGATFVAGVASVGLVRLWGAAGRVHPALEGYRTLLAGWRRSGHWTQMWTTARNLATLLAEVGQPDAAVTLLAAADASTEAADVQVEVVAAELAAVRAELVERLGAERVGALQARAARMPRGRRGRRGAGRHRRRPGVTAGLGDRHTRAGVDVGVGPRPVSPAGRCARDR